MRDWMCVLLITALGTGMTGCSNMNLSHPASSKEYLGMFGGAIAGGLAGSALHQKGGERVTAIGIGALVGALVGLSIAMAIDQRDEEKSEMLINNIPDNKPIKSHTMTQTEMSSSNQAQNISTASKPIGSSGKTTKSFSMNERLLSFWHSLPSTQWFINDEKPAQVG